MFPHPSGVLRFGGRWRRQRPSTAANCRRPRRIENTAPPPNPVHQSLPVTRGGLYGSTPSALLPSVQAVTCHRRPQRCRSSVAAGGDGTEGREPSLHMDASASILRPLSPYGPDKRGLPSFPPISCPAVLWLLGQARNKVLRIRGTGGLAALPAVGTTTAACEIGAG